MIRIRTAIARWLAPEREILFDLGERQLEERRKDIDLEVNNRVADVLLKMDPFEPFLKKYNVIFSEEWARPEDNLDSPSRLRLFMWAYGVAGDPSFKHLTDWIRNTQGNATLRKARTDPEWFYGRSAIATITLFVEEVGRLASHYKEIMERGGQTFDKNLPIE